MSEQYVYDGRLVRKTGRVAFKKHSTPRRTTSASEQCIYEIEPAEGDIEWKKWVRDDELYVIKDEGE